MLKKIALSKPLNFLQGFLLIFLVFVLFLTNDKHVLTHIFCLVILGGSLMRMLKFLILTPQYAKELEKKEITLTDHALARLFFDLGIVMAWGLGLGLMFINLVTIILQ